MTLTYDVLERLVEWARKKAWTWQGKSRVRNVQFNGVGYAEPGYTDPASGWIALGNWNNIGLAYDNEKRKFTCDDRAPSLLARALEKLGVELEWEDEWTECMDCGKLVRTSPDSYSWQRSYAVVDECDLLCHKCIVADPSDYLAEMEGNSGHAITFDLDLEGHDYVRVERDYETGLHHSQDNDPHKVASVLREAGIERFIFVLDSTGQFDFDWSVWIHKSEENKLGPVEKRLDPYNRDTRMKKSPAQSMQEALRDAEVKEAAIERKPGDILVTKCKGDGTAEVRSITPQEFVDGKALKGD